jgi:hypothetical protein
MALVPDEIPEALGLDPRLVRRIASGTEAYAATIDDDRDRGQRGNVLALAGAYYALVDPAMSMRLFGESLHGHHDSPAEVSVVTTAIAICADDVLTLQRQPPGWPRHGPPVSPAEPVVAAALGQAWIDVRGSSPYYKPGEGGLPDVEQPTPVGRLGIPAYVVTRVAQASASAVPGEQDRIARPITGYLERVYEIVSRARRDRFHWSRLLSTVVPVEPEALASCMIAALATRQSETPPLSAAIDLPPAALAPLRIAELFVDEAMAAWV